MVIKQPTVDPHYGIGVLPPFMRPVTIKKVYTPAETKSPEPRYYLLEDHKAGIFTSLAALDAHIHQELNGTVRYEADLLPRAGDPDHPLQGSGFLIENASLSKPGAGGGVYIFGSDDLATKVDGWVYKYEQFLDTAERFLQKPDDFFLAYYFLNAHPTFYHRYNVESDDWEQNSGLAGVWQDVSSGETPGSVMFGLEHGPYNDDTKTQHTHDYYIDGYGPSYESAIINMAANVHSRYNLLGLDRDEPLDFPGANK